MYGNQQLPFSATEALSGNWINNPLQDRLPLPNLNLDPNLQWILPVVAAGFIDELQKNSYNAGPVSTFAYNFFSTNFYNNRQFADVLADAFELALFMISRQGARDQRSIENLAFGAGGSHSATAAALCTRYFPELYQMLDGQGRYAVDQTIGKWEQIQNVMYNRQPQRPMGGGYQSHPGQQGGGYDYRRGGPGPGDATAYAMRGGALGGTGGVRPQPINTRGSGRTGAQLGRQPEVEQRPMSDALMKKLGLMDENGNLIKQEEPLAEAPNEELASLGVVERQGSALRNQAFRDEGLVQDHRPRPESFDFFGEDAVKPAQETAQAGQAHPNAKSDAKADPLEPADEEDWVQDIDFANEAAPASQAGAGYPPVDNGRIILPVPPVGLKEEELLSWYELNAHQSFKVSKFLSDVEHPWDKVLLDNGMTMLAALRNPDVKPSRTDRRPNPGRPYNPETHVKFYLISADGETVTEAILQKEESMEYVNHELNDRLRAEELRRLNAKDNVMPDWSVVADIKPRVSEQTAGLESLFFTAKDKEYEEVREEGQPEVDNTLRQQPVLVAGEQYGELSATLSKIDQYRVAALKGGADRSVVEAHGCAMQPFAVKVSKEIVEALTNVVKASDPALALVEALAAYGDEVKDRFYNRVNDLMAKRVNDVILYSLGITDLRITSFVDDWADLVLLVKEEYGDGNCGRLATLAGTAAAQLRILPGDAPGLTERLMDLDGIDLAFFEENKERFVVLQHQYNVLFINSGLSKLGIHSDFKEPTQICISDQPDLFKLVSEADGRTKSMNAGHGGSVYVVSADDRILQLHPSAWDKFYYSVAVAPATSQSVL